MAFWDPGTHGWVWLMAIICNRWGGGVLRKYRDHMLLYRQLTVVNYCRAAGINDFPVYIQLLPKVPSVISLSAA